MDRSLTTRKPLSLQLIAAMLGLVIAAVGLAPSAALADEAESASNLQPGVVAIQADGSYPATYNADISKLANVTPIRLQNPWNDCWAFAATSAMESSILAAKLETDNKANFLSPRHLATFAILGHGEGNQSEEGMTMVTGVNVLNAGNTASTVVGALAAGWGPALEKPYPYIGAKGLIEYAKKPDGSIDTDKPLNYSEEDDWSIEYSKATDVAPYQLKAAYAVGSTATFSNPDDKAKSTYSLNEDAVKQTKSLVMDYGGVSVDYLSDHSSVAEDEADDLNEFNKDFKESNHSVEIVGWDDNYSRNHFTEKGTPEGDGAWLCKNSWGAYQLGFPNHNDQVTYNGYFWLSYYDRTIDNITAYELTAASDPDYGTSYIDQYDYLGRRTDMSDPVWTYDDEARYANIFTAQQDETVTHVSLELYRNSTSSEIYVYKLYDNAKNPQDGVLVCSQSVDTPIAGFYKVKLATPLALKKGERYSIVESVKTKENKYNVPIEFAQTDGKTQKYHQKAVINDGESWMFVAQDEGWVDAKTKMPELTAQANKNSKVTWELGNVMVKGYATAYDERYAVSTETRTMYRLYNSYSGEHLFTASTEERDTLAQAGWTDEGTAWIAPLTSKTPVYRLYNPYEPLGDHHYTTSKQEYDDRVKDGWKGEDISWYSSTTDDAALYRVYNPNAYAMGMSGAHHYTASKEEAEGLVNMGWKDEGIAWYGVFQYQ